MPGTHKHAERARERERQRVKACCLSLMKKCYSNRDKRVEGKNEQQVTLIITIIIGAEQLGTRRRRPMEIDGEKRSGRIKHYHWLFSSASLFFPSAAVVQALARTTSTTTTIGVYWPFETTRRKEERERAPIRNADCQ